MFDTYYRLDRSTQSNMTEATYAKSDTAHKTGKMSLCEFASFNKKAQAMSIVLLLICLMLRRLLELKIRALEILDKWTSTDVLIEPDKILSAQLKIVSKPILLSTLGPNNTSDQKCTPRENNTENYNPVLEDCDMVSKPTETIYSTTTASTSNHSDSNPKKWKITLHKKQALALGGIMAWGISGVRSKTKGLEITQLILYLQQTTYQA
ncbi:hypothetical protein BB561_005209 [Smittium simulii]|uniref:Uncharacterized protein n=1 Tax=Smittium simulii TaxID=133385 RepID=A0A2T9YBJ0_9FUNG|nr:hypothetical protein BB561_005209 [Smittium simulii]